MTNNIFGKLHGGGGGSSLVCESFTVPPMATLATSIPSDDFVKLSVQAFSGSSLVPSVGTIDPDNSSSLDPSVRDTNFSNLVYNNTSPGSANKTLPAIDLGQPEVIQFIRVGWWNGQSYGATQYQIEASNDGSSWDVVTPILANVNTATGTFDDTTISTSQAYQYWRVRCIQGVNATWFVISELQAFQASAQEEFWPSTSDIIPSGNNSLLNLENTTAASLTCRVCYMQG